MHIPWVYMHAHYICAQVYTCVCEHAFGNHVHICVHIGVGCLGVHGVRYSIW